MIMMITMVVMMLTMIVMVVMILNSKWWKGSMVEERKARSKSLLTWVLS